MIVEKQPMSFGDYLTKFDNLTTDLHNLETEMDRKFDIHKNDKDREKSKSEFEKIKKEITQMKKLSKVLPVDNLLKLDTKEVEKMSESSTSTTQELRYGTDIKHKELTKFVELVLTALKNRTGRLSSSWKFKDKGSELMYGNIVSYGEYRLYTFSHVSQKVEIHDKESDEREVGELHFLIKNNKPTVYIDEWYD